MKIIEKKCPNCGANLDFKVGERDIKCLSCHRSFAIEYDQEVKNLEDLIPDNIELSPLRNVTKIITSFIFATVFLTIIASVVFIIIAIRQQINFSNEFESIRQENQSIELDED